MKVLFDRAMPFVDECYLTTTVSTGRESTGCTVRLLVLNYEYPPLGGGASPVTAAICRELSRRGDHVDVVTMRFRGLPKIEAAGQLRIFRVPCLRSARHICYVHELLTYIVSSFFKALHLLRSQPYDLVHAHFFLPSGLVAYALFKMTGIPYVVTAHGSDVKGYNPHRFRNLHRIVLPVWRKVLRSARAVTSPSRYLANLIERNNGNPCSIQIIPNGIEENWIEPRTKERYLLVVSRLFERKGVQYLLQALHGPPLGYDVHIVGDGPYRGVLEDMAKGIADRVIFHGWLANDSSELKSLYRKASIFVFPSLAENFPVCLLEAMLSGAAVVASSIDGCHEVLGDAAHFVPPGNALALRNELLALTANEATRVELGGKARRRVLEHFTWRKLGGCYYDFFNRTAEAAAPIRDGG